MFRFCGVQRKLLDTSFNLNLSQHALFFVVLQSQQRHIRALYLDQRSALLLLDVELDLLDNALDAQVHDVPFRLVLLRHNKLIRLNSCSFKNGNLL